jgi:hypothetical protein
MLSVNNRENEKREKSLTVKSKTTNEGKGSMAELVGLMNALGKKRSRSPSVSSDLGMTGYLTMKMGVKGKE